MSMSRVLALAAFSACASIVQAAPLMEQTMTPVMDTHFTWDGIKDFSSQSVVAANALYSNVTTFSGFGTTAGGSTASPTVLVTNQIADDINLPVGGTVASYKFSVANFNSAATTARMRVRFYDSTGAGGGPGAILSAISFSPIAIPSGVTTFNTGPLLANQFPVPSGNLWASIFFDNSGASGTTATALDGLGLGTFNPVDLGSSLDRHFTSPVANQPYNGSHPGTISVSPFAGNPVANYGFELVAIPEPTTSLLAGAGLALLVRRRKA